MDGVDNKVILKWEGHNNDLLKLLQIQRKAKQFTDVSLAVGETTIEAHKVVLSACSTYFAKILNRLGDCSHPVIVLKDPSPSQMRALVDYMYTGEMSVSHQDMVDITTAAKNLGIHLGVFPPLATSETLEKLNQHSGQASGSSTGHHGRKSYRPKQIRTSPDSGNGWSTLSDANITSPDSNEDRSYPSCPSRESSSPTDHLKTDEGQIGEKSKLQLLDNNAPVDFSVKSEASGLRLGPGPETQAQKDKKSVLDSYLRNGSDASLTPDQSGSASSVEPVSNSHLLAAQNLAWLSQRGYDKKSQISDQESDKESNKTSSSIGISPMANGLPSVNMDIASRIQNALWATHFSKDQAFASPYGSWMNPAMNPAMNPGFAAIAAAAAAMKSGASAFPTSNLSSPGPESPATLTVRSQASLMSPSYLPDPASEGQTSIPSLTGSSGRGRGRQSSGHQIIGPSGKPMVSCDICGKRLADPSSLYRHRKIHSGDKPHQCPYCKKEFIQRYNMTQHIKTHFKDRGINSIATNGFANFANLAAGVSGGAEANQTESGENSRPDTGLETDHRHDMIGDDAMSGNDGEEDVEEEGDEEVIEPC